MIVSEESGFHDSDDSLFPPRKRYVDKLSFVPFESIDVFFCSPDDQLKLAHNLIISHMKQYHSSPLIHGDRIARDQRASSNNEEYDPNHDIDLGSSHSKFNILSLFNSIDGFER